MRMTIEQAYEQRAQLREQAAQLRAGLDETRRKLDWIDGHIAAMEPDDDEASEPTPLRAVETGD